MALHLSCPECGAQFDLVQAMEDADGRRLLDMLKEIQPLVIRPYFRYLKLFKPQKQGLRWSKMLTLTKELAPMIKEAQINYNHAMYVVPPTAWADAMNDLVDNPSATLKLPLKGHGYLLSILSANAEKVAAKAERKTEEDNQRPREGVGSGLKQVMDVVETVRQKHPEGFLKNAVDEEIKKQQGNEHE